MNARNGINNLSAAICEYYHGSVDYIGSSITSMKSLRNNISFFQKTCINQMSSIHLFNALRGTSQLVGLANKLETAYVADIFGWIKQGHEWFKPFNANTVHANALLSKVSEAYARKLDLSPREAREKIRPQLKKFLEDLDNPGPNTGRQFGYGTSSEFLTRFRDHINTSHIFYEEHFDAVLGRIVNAYEPIFAHDDDREGFIQDLRSTFENFLENLISHNVSHADSHAFCRDLQVFMNFSSDRLGEDFNLADSVGEFSCDDLEKLKKWVSAKNFDLAEAVGEVPLKEISWAKYIANQMGNCLSVMTVVYFLKEWDLLNTANIAANIGKIGVFEWVGKIDFYTGFSSAILLGYASLLVDSGSRLYKSMSNPDDRSIGPVAKYNASWDTAVAALECFFYAMGIAGVWQSNPVWMALSMISGKSVGMFSIVMKKSDLFDTPADLGSAAPSLPRRISEKVQAVLSPVTHQKHVAILLNKISFVAGKILSFIGTLFDYLNEVVDLEKDGFDKLYKSLIPKLSIADHLLKRNGASPMFAKCRQCFEWHKELVCATKIFSSLPNWWVYNPQTKHNEIRCPLYKWNADRKAFELKLTDSSRWVTLLGDMSNLCDTTKFLHKNQVYRFDYFVSIGQKIYESQIPVFGAYVKNVPVAKQIYSSPKNILVVIMSLLDMGVQLKNYFIKGDKKQFNWENSFKFAGNIGKVAVIWWDAPGLLGFDILASLTGDAGLIKYWISQSKAKKRFNSPLQIA